MNKKNRYPPRLWPDAELPLPRVQLHKVGLDAHGWLTPDLGSLELATPPSELHLREMREVATSSPEAIRVVSEVVGTVVDYSAPWRGVVNRSARAHLAQGHAQLQADNIGAQLSLPPADWDLRPTLAVHVREVALRLEYVRLLVNHTRCALAGELTAPLWQKTGAFDVDDMTSAMEALSTTFGVTPVGEESPEAVAWARYSAFLNDGLDEISPRIMGQGLASEPDFGDVTTSYAAACAMVFNDLRDGLPYKECADETCGRLFKRQLGRSKGINKPRSSGVEFCTWSHARNQSRRERRRAERQMGEK